MEKYRLLKAFGKWHLVSDSQFGGCPDKPTEAQEKFLEVINNSLDCSLTERVCRRTLRDCVVEDMIIDNITLHYCEFTEVTFKNCIFTTNTILNKVSFYKCTFINTQFIYSTINGSVVECSMIDSTFSRCFIGGESFYVHVHNVTYHTFLEGCVLKTWVQISCTSNITLFGNSFTETLQLTDEHQVDRGVLLSERTGTGIVTLRRNMYKDIHVNKGVTVVHDIPLVCPPTGSFLGYKCAIRSYDNAKSNADNHVLITLRITEDALRSSGMKRKCRASQAEVVSIVDRKGNEVEKAYAWYDEGFVYRKGAIVEPVQEFDTDRFEECASGIHFFMTKEEAWELADNLF